MRRLLLGLIVVVALALIPQTSSAHVLLMDTTSSTGAILHINPDDDPIAGEESDIYFDRQSAKESVAEEVSLSIRIEDGSIVTVETETSGTLTTAQYAFPDQGLYTMTFVAKNGDTEYTFEQSQRVTRGVSVVNDATASYAWAEALLVFCGIGFLVLLVIFFNHRKEINKYSTF